MNKDRASELLEMVVDSHVMDLYDFKQKYKITNQIDPKHHAIAAAVAFVITNREIEKLQRI